METTHIAIFKPVFDAGTYLVKTNSLFTITYVLGLKRIIYRIFQFKFYSKFICKLLQIQNAIIIFLQHEVQRVLTEKLVFVMISMLLK